MSSQIGSVGNGWPGVNGKNHRCHPTHRSLPSHFQAAFAASDFEARIVHPFATKQFRQPGDPGNKTNDTDLMGGTRPALHRARGRNIEWHKQMSLALARSSSASSAADRATQTDELLKTKVAEY